MTSEAKCWKPKAAQTVARRVVETIMQQCLTTGDRLPREAPDDHTKVARAVASGHHRVARELMREHIEGVWAQCRSQVMAGHGEAVRWL